MHIKEWEYPLLRQLIVNQAVMTSAQAKQFLDDHGKGMSRASVINTLNRWSDAGILQYVEEDCLGGQKRIYRRVISGDEYLAQLWGELNEVYTKAHNELKGG